MLRITALMMLCLSASAASALDFTPCEIAPAGAAPYRAECARLRVAEDAARPEGRQLDLRVVRLPARARKPQPDPVIFIAGGPGQSAVDSWPQVVPGLRALNRDRHILLLDQRGTGGSHRLACPLPDWRREASLSAAEAQQLALQCRDRLSATADLRHYTTSDAVRDIETLRKAVGAPQLNVAGGSYGTRVALEYLRRHPAQVRTLLLDSVVPPELALLQDHARNLEEALNAHFARCRADAACTQRFADPARTLARLRQQLAHKPQRVRFNDPLDGRPREEWLTLDVLSAILRLFSYGPHTAALLPLLLDQVQQGQGGSLYAQAEQVYESLSDQLAHGMELSVLCAEDADLLRPRREDADTLLGNLAVDYAQAQCKVWPRGERPADFKQPVRAAVPTLLLAGEWDPVTPPRYAEQVAATLTRSRVLTARGQGHIVMNTGCMPRLIEKFVQSADPTPLDAACLDTLAPPPFWLSPQGPAP